MWKYILLRQFGIREYPKKLVISLLFCILDEFCKNLDAELTKNLHIAPIDEGYKRMRNRKGQMSKSEIMTILLCYHFGSFRNFKHYYLFFIKEHLASCKEKHYSK